MNNEDPLEQSARKLLEQQRALGEDKAPERPDRNAELDEAAKRLLAQIEEEPDGR